MKIKIFASLFLLMTTAAFGQSTEFSYQGNLNVAGVAANGNFDFEFRLFDSLAAGGQIGPLLTRNVAVANGTFAVKLDFGNFFNGADRFLEVRVRNVGGSGYTILDPRQRVGSSPYAIKSLLAETANTANSATTASNATTATTATNALQLGGVAANQFVVTTDPRMTNARVPTAGSADYVQNTANQQAASNFNISGNGTAAGTLNANVVSATTQYNIGSSRVLSATGAGFGQRTSLGINSGIGGNSNTFMGYSAGSLTTAGANTFIGSQAGLSNTTGNSNTTVGALAGVSLSTGSNNSFFGRDTGNGGWATGSNNVLVGGNAGNFGGNGSNNTFIGANTSAGGTDMDHVTVIGADAYTGGITSNTVIIGRPEDKVRVFGELESTGPVQASQFHIGNAAILSSPVSSNNTALGRNSSVSAGLTFATAIGSGAVATESSSVWLGRASDIVYIPGFLRLAQLGGAGSTALCRNNANTIGTCSSSLRYKTNIGRTSLGLDLIKRLRPITFDWKDGGMHDLGLGAEDVAAIEPLLVTYNKDGAVEGVKYDRIGVVLINAVKGQQAQIEKLAEQNRRQQLVIESLVRSMCKQNASDAVCKELK